MCLKNLLSIIYFVLAVSFCVVSAQICGDSLLLKPNSTYETNRRLILSTLAVNVSSRDGFYSGSVGEGTETTYALGLCIPGTDPKVCSDCIQSVSIFLLQSCQNHTDSFDWRGDSWRGDKTLCFVRSSNHSFFDSIELEPSKYEYNNADITGNFTEFNRIWEELMERMIVAASSSTPESPIRKHYAAGMTPWTRFVSIYALMQCIPGISSKECDVCLRANVRTFQQFCSGKQGAGVERPACYFRWDLFSFLGAFDNITSSPPPQSIQGPHSMPPLGDLPNSTKKGGKNFPIWGIIVPAIILLLLILGFVVYCKKMMMKKKKRKLYKPMKLETAAADIPSSYPLQYDLKTIEAATDNFSSDNKLGEGGFGVVYKGLFPNGTEAAVKRLSITSRQGLQEFKNEVIVVGKLQHNNLVRLLGYCMEEKEKILVYEFLSNKSLDLFLFDAINRLQLDWTTRYNIIEGIARGILYLHQDSRLRVIHRDLKASNILLDDAMKPKIADFGLAKIFAMEQSRAETSKIAGTFGYMPPEYMSHGQFSMESDVYSFGVLVLEIISGNTSSSFYWIDDTDCNLGTYAWKLWRKDSALTLVDPTFGENYQIEQVTRCIHIALLCVQADPSKRPKLFEIISMLTTSKISESVPCEPGFLTHSRS